MPKVDGIYDCLDTASCVGKDDGYYYDCQNCGIFYYCLSEELEDKVECPKGESYDI